MHAWQHYLDDLAFSFRKQKEFADKALAQVADEHYFHKPGEHSNAPRPCATMPRFCVACRST